MRFFVNDQGCVFHASGLVASFGAANSYEKDTRWMFMKTLLMKLMRG